MNIKKTQQSLINAKQASPPIQDYLQFVEGISIDLVEGRANLQVKIPPIYNLILKIRQAAVRNFPSKPFELYLYGETVYLFRIDLTDINLPTKYSNYAA